MTIHVDIDAGDRLVTGLDGDFAVHVTGEVQRRIAVYKSGRVFMVQDALDHLEVETIIEVLEKRGVPVKLDSAVIVDRGTLRAMYEGKTTIETAERVAAQPRSAELSDGEKRQDIYRLLDRGRKLSGTSDIIVKYWPDQASVHAIVDGVQQNWTDLQWTPEYTLEFQKAANAWAGDEGGSAELGWINNKHQKGSITTGLPPGLDTVRMEFSAAAFGGKELIMRLQHRPPGGRVDLRKLHFPEPVIRSFRSILNLSGGLIGFTGPTGHGKTNSMYGAQNESLELFPGDRWVNIENPTEIRIRHPNVTQIDILRVAADGDLAKAWDESLGSAMRAIPRKLIIGEVIFAHQAATAVRAAMTGHTVLFTAHTPDPMGTIDRLLDLGISPRVLSRPSFIRALVGQRLFRCVCPHCSAKITKADWKEDMLDWLDAAFDRAPHLLLANQTGCKHCRQGYLPGRVPVTEIVRPTRDMLELLIAGRDDDARLHWETKLGGISLISQVIDGLVAGKFDPVEAIRCLDF